MSSTAISMGNMFSMMDLSEDHLSHSHFIYCAQCIGNFTHSNDHAHIYGAYKRVDKKVRPVSKPIPIEFKVTRTIPYDPLATLPRLSRNPPEFSPTTKLTQERLDSLELDKSELLWPEEIKLFQQILLLNEEALAFEDEDRGTLKEAYFSPYKIPTVDHEPWQEKNIPIPPGIKDQVLDVLRLKIRAGVYEPCQSPYRSKWFCVVKKNGKLWIVHDLQPLNRVTIRESAIPPNLDQFVEKFVGGKCFTVFDLFWGFDARKMDQASRDMTAFLTPLGMLHLTSLPTGYTNSPAEFQECMLFILKDELAIADVFIDDLPIKGPTSIYPDRNGNPSTLPENPGIRKYIWEHANDVHRIMHRIKDAGATFSALKIQLCLPEVKILGQIVNIHGRVPDQSKVDKVLNWPPPRNVKEARGFLGLCGTVRIWIPNYSTLTSPITELWRKGADFEWTERRQEAFDALKQALTSAPALWPIDYHSGNPIILSVDSSYIAVGIILSQLDDNGHKRPARYGSLPFSDVESRYAQSKLELYGLYRAMRHFRLYIIGAKNLIVEVDAKYIKGMLNDPDLQPNAVVNRWIQGILLFDFTLKHVPATQFKGPDALSRRPLANDETIEQHDDSWLDHLSLLYQDMLPEPTPSVCQFEKQTTHTPYALALSATTA